MTSLSLLVALSLPPLASASLPPYLVINRGVLNVETPDGTIIVIPEGSWMYTNHISVRLDNREVILDNVLIFRDGFPR